MTHDEYKQKTPPEHEPVIEYYYCHFCAAKKPDTELKYDSINKFHVCLDVDACMEEQSVNMKDNNG